jgi:hypothetical protein
MLYYKKSVKCLYAFFIGRNLNKCVTPARFERATHSLEGCCSIQLSYGAKISNLFSICLIP